MVVRSRVRFDGLRRGALRLRLGRAGGGAVESSFRWTHPAGPHSPPRSCAPCGRKRDGGAQSGEAAGGASGERQRSASPHRAAERRVTYQRGSRAMLLARAKCVGVSGGQRLGAGWTWATGRRRRCGRHARCARVDLHVGTPRVEADVSTSTPLTLLDGAREPQSARLGRNDGAEFEEERAVPGGAVLRGRSGE